MVKKGMTQVSSECTEFRIKSKVFYSHQLKEYNKNNGTGVKGKRI